MKRLTKKTAAPAPRINRRLPTEAEKNSGTPGEHLGRAVTFLSLAQTYADDGAVASAIELTEGALEWLKIVRDERQRAGVMAI